MIIKYQLNCITSCKCQNISTWDDSRTLCLHSCLGCIHIFESSKTEIGRRCLLGVRSFQQHRPIAALINYIDTMHINFEYRYNVIRCNSKNVFYLNLAAGNRRPHHFWNACMCIAITSSLALTFHVKMNSTKFNCNEPYHNVNMV